MKKVLILTLFFILCGTIVAASANESAYDAIVVRNDIPIEYIIAAPYAATHNIPIMQVSKESLTGEEEKQLSGYYQNGARRILILGGMQSAISEDIESTIREMGYDVDRKWGLGREITASIFAIDLWQTSPNVVLLNGSVPESYLVGMQIAMNLESPILLTDDNSLPDVTKKALEELGCKMIYVVGPSINDSILDEITAMNINYKRIGTDINPHDVEQDSKTDISGLIAPIPFILGIICGGVLLYALLKIRTSKRMPEVPLFVLTEDERKVVDAIGKSGGELRQELLPDLTNFSRPKVSRIVNDLEGKKIFIREKKGKTYKVRIAKKFINKD